MKRLMAVLALLHLLVHPGCAGLESDQPDAGFEEDGRLFPPDFWNPGEKPAWNCSYGYGENCPAPEVDCAKDPCIHGVCIEGESDAVADHCLCDAGYAGLLCDQCARGFLPDGLKCVPDDPCRESPCVYGTCRIRDGEMSCDCYSGYAGTYCDECAEEYHVENMECVPD